MKWKNLSSDRGGLCALSYKHLQCCLLIRVMFMWPCGWHYEHHTELHQILKLLGATAGHILNEHNWSYKQDYSLMPLEEIYTEVHINFDEKIHKMPIRLPVEINAQNSGNLLPWGSSSVFKAESKLHEDRIHLAILYSGQGPINFTYENLVFSKNAIFLFALNLCLLLVMPFSYSFFHSVWVFCLLSSNGTTIVQIAASRMLLKMNWS